LLRALNFLLDAGKLPKDHPVACRVLDIDAAEQSELSLIENVIRLDMTPTDEIRAYKHFVNEGSDLDAIAKRFGRTRRFIEGRLRLADLADPIFTALEEGKITLDVAKAYATTPNHERQMLVWNELSNSWQGTPASRRAASGPFLTRTKLGHPEGDLFNSFDRRLT
jgi:ParB family chromosome partitioning protein